jgi:ubiquinone/menaquinone biosynthesis C-methylase UbiE
VERYVIRGGQPGYERLRVLAQAWRPSTLALFDRVQLRPGMHCLDLGCGGGEVTFEMARRVGPDGQVTGIDMDDVKLALGREAAAGQGLANVELRSMNVYDFNERNAYDLVYCRFLLQHLARPVEMLGKMWAAVRPGGVIVTEDADFDGQFCEPPNDGFDFWVEAYQRVLEHHDGDPKIGRKLFRYYAAAGIPAPEVNVVQRVEMSGEAKTLPGLTVEATAEAMVREGIATDDQVQAALLDLKRLADDPATMIGSPRTIQAWTRRPAS